MVKYPRPWGSRVVTPSPPAITTRRSGRMRAIQASGIGDAPGKSTAKKCMTSNNTLISKDTRVMYETELSDLAKQTTGQIDRRERDAAHILGFKINFQMRHLGTTTTGPPLQFTWAVIAAKNNNTTPLPVTDFFRTYGSARSANFATTLNAIEFGSNPINEDLYRVLWKSTCMIGTQGASTNQPPSHKTIAKYIPLNRQITYDSVSGTPNTRIWVVYWFDYPLNNAGAGSTAAVASVLQNHITYFKEPDTSKTTILLN